MTESKAIKIERDSWGRLVLSFEDGQAYVGIEPVRCFPLSDPDQMVALIDAEGREIMTLPNLNSLSPAAREMVESELSAREFVPVIERVISTSHPFPPCVWRVATDRGETQFQLESEDDIRKLTTHRVMIADSHGIRYSIADIRKLDAASQKIIRRLV